jgi:hypothetical protein
MKMVWGLELPTGFGPFFPDGDFVGYKEQLEAAFNAMTADAKAYYDNQVTGYRLHVSQCFNYEHGTMHGEQRVFRPLAEAEWPREFQIKRQYRRLGSLIKSVNMLLLVDKALKEIIEHLEPDIHQFRPTKLTFTKDEAYPRDYFTMVIGTFLTSFDPDQSGKGSFTKLGVYHSSHFDEETASKLAFRKSMLNGHHLWRERELKTPDLFCLIGFSPRLAKRV